MHQMREHGTPGHRPCRAAGSPWRSRPFSSRPGSSGRRGYRDDGGKCKRGPSAGPHQRALGRGGLPGRPIQAGDPARTQESKFLRPSHPSAGSGQLLTFGITLLSTRNPRKPERLVARSALPTVFKGARQSLLGHLAFEGRRRFVEPSHRKCNIRIVPRNSCLGKSGWLELALCRLNIDIVAVGESQNYHPVFPGDRRLLHGNKYQNTHRLWLPCTDGCRILKEESDHCDWQ